MFTCTKCSTTYSDQSHFGSWPRNKWCKACSAEYQRNLRAEGYKPSGRNKALSANPDAAMLKHLSRAINNAAGNCRKLGRPAPFLVVSELHALLVSQGRKCALTGLPLTCEAGSPWVASLDQIEPAVGYVIENVQLVCWAANRAKGDLSREDFLLMCDSVVRLAQD